MKHLNRRSCSAIPTCMKPPHPPEDSRISTVPGMVGVAVLNSTRIPLTLTLSHREREQSAPGSIIREFGRADTALGFAVRQRRILPLPRGEYLFTVAAGVPPAAFILSCLRRCRRWLTFPALAAVLAQSGPVCAAEKAVRINLGTLAPRGSTYHQSLQAMAERWKQVPGGGARLVSYPDGTQGGETDMVRLMRVGSLHAGLLTAAGLAEIEPGVTGLQTLPMMFRTFDELEFVNDQLRPTLEKRLAEKGFVVLFWVDAGWVRYFSKEPMLTLDDMKKRNVFVWYGNAAQV